MSESCGTKMCKSPSRVQCLCCKNSFCRNHFFEHDNLPNLQLNSLTDEINMLWDRLTALSVDQLSGDAHQKLERWRIDCHKTIEDAFEQKYREIDQRANKKVIQQRDEVSKIQSTIAELIRKQETTTKDIDSLNASIHTIEQAIKNMEHTCFEVIIRPLVVDDNFIRMEELFMPQLELSTLSSPYQTIDHIGESSRKIASNDRFLLIHQQSNLCLIDRELKVIKKNQWAHGGINEMCWSSTLSRFFVIIEIDVLVVDENTMSIEVVKINQNERWFSCTCSDTTLFLLPFRSGSPIYEFSLSPSILLKKQWQCPATCAQNEIIINAIYKNKTLALMIDDSFKRKLIELRSVTTLEKIWSSQLDIEHYQCIFGCCSLNCDDWLVWNYHTSRLLRITKDGKTQTTTIYNEKPRYVILFYKNELIISTSNGINFHKIKS